MLNPSSNETKKTENTNTQKQYSWKKIFFRIFLVILNLAVLIGFFYLFVMDWDNVISSNNLQQNGWYEKITTQLIEYKNIWDTHQWVVSLIGLFVLYAVLIILLNWTGLTRPITRGEGFLLISFDLLLNFIVGLSYMGYHDTIIGGLMLQCPIALSPFILAIELTVYVLYVLWKKK